MGIPWILSWHYSLIPFLPGKPYSLVREYRVKWWDKYNMDRCSLSNLEKWIQTHQQIKHQVASVSRALPPIQTKPPTPNSSSESTTSSSGSKKSKGKEKLKKLSRPKQCKYPHQTMKTTLLKIIIHSVNRYFKI